MWLAALLLLQAAPVPPLREIPPATIDDTLEVEGEALAAREVRTRLVLPVTIDGDGPHAFVVDSGADRTVVARELAARLALPPGAVVTVHGVTGTVRVPTARIATLGMGGVRVAGLAAPTLAAADLGAAGLLGIDALRGQRLRLDFVRGTITVQDSRSRQPDIRPDDIVVTARRRKGQLILTEVRIGRVRVEAVVDTGSEVTIGNAALRRRLRMAPGAARATMLIGATGGTIPAEIAQVPEVEIGTLRLGGVAIAFADVAPFALFGLAERPALLLGNDVLRAFARVSLDFGGRRVRFQRRR